jgi:glucuronate isomerase
MSTPLELHEDRLFPAEPGIRALARELYANVADLPIISPHGHTDPAWFAHDEPFGNATELLLHPDHFASGEAALPAVFPSSRDRLTFTELLREGLEPHKVKEVWMMFHGDTADKFVDVSAYMDTAVDALKQHQTQVSEEDAEVGMRQWRNSTGQKVGFEFAEAFKVFQLG